MGVALIFDLMFMERRCSSQNQGLNHMFPKSEDDWIFGLNFRKEHKNNKKISIGVMHFDDLQRRSHMGYSNVTSPPVYSTLLKTNFQCFKTF